MIGLKMVNGELIFGRVEEVDEFWQRVVNALKIYDTECFYDENLGLNIRMIFEQRVSEYKLEHIKGKLLEWYKTEIDAVEYQILSESDRTLKVKLYLTHKKYGHIEKEVRVIG